MSMLTQALRWGRSRPERETRPTLRREPEAAPVSDEERVVQRLAALGIAGGLADTLHVLCLPSLEAVRRAAEALRQDGRFVEFDNGPDGWRLVVVQSVELEPADILALRAELEDVVRSAGGRYAGWEIVGAV